MDRSEAGKHGTTEPSDPEVKPKSHQSGSLAGDTSGSATEKAGYISQNVSGADEQRDAGRTSASPSRPRRPCRAPGCQVDVSRAKSFNWRYRICEQHRSAQSVMINGEPMRFCQMCAKFQPLEEFSGGSIAMMHVYILLVSVAISSVVVCSLCILLFQDKHQTTNVNELYKRCAVYFYAGTKMSCQTKLDEHNARRRVGTSSNFKKGDRGTKTELSLARLSVPDAKATGAETARNVGAGVGFPQASASTASAHAGYPTNFNAEGTGTVHLLAAFESLASHLGVPFPGLSAQSRGRSLGDDTQPQLAVPEMTSNKDLVSMQSRERLKPYYFGRNVVQPGSSYVGGDGPSIFHQPADAFGTRRRYDASFGLPSAADGVSGARQPASPFLGPGPGPGSRQSSQLHAHTGMSIPHRTFGGEIGQAAPTIPPSELRSLAQLVASAVSNRAQNPFTPHMLHGGHGSGSGVLADEWNVLHGQGPHDSQHHERSLVSQPAFSAIPLPFGDTPQPEKKSVPTTSHGRPEDGLTVADGRTATIGQTSKDQYPSDSYVTRLSVKLFDCEPKDLEPHLREEVEGLMDVSSNLLETYLRAGCAHITLELKETLSLNSREATENNMKFGIQVAKRLSSAVLKREHHLHGSKFKFFLVQVDSVIGVGRISRLFSNPADILMYVKGTEEEVNKLPNPTLNPTSKLQRSYSENSFPVTNEISAIDAMVFDSNILTKGLPKAFCINPACLVADSSTGDDEVVKLSLIGENAGVAYFCRQQGKYLPMNLEYDVSECLFPKINSSCVTLVIPAVSLCHGCAEIEVERELIVGDSVPVLVLPNTREGVKAMDEINEWYGQLAMSRGETIGPLIKNGHRFLRDLGRLITYNPGNFSAEDMSIMTSNVLSFATGKGMSGVTSLLQR